MVTSANGSERVSADAPRPSGNPPEADDFLSRMLAGLGVPEPPRGSSGASPDAGEAVPEPSAEVPAAGPVEAARRARSRALPDALAQVPAAEVPDGALPAAAPGTMPAASPPPDGAAQQMTEPVPAVAPVPSGSDLAAPAAGSPGGPRSPFGGAFDAAAGEAAGGPAAAGPAERPGPVPASSSAVPAPAREPAAVPAAVLPGAVADPETVEVDSPLPGSPASGAAAPAAGGPAGPGASSGELLAAAATSGHGFPDVVYWYTLLAQVRRHAGEHPDAVFAIDQCLQVLILLAQAEGVAALCAAGEQVEVAEHWASSHRDLLRAQAARAAGRLLGDLEEDFLGDLLGTAVVDQLARLAEASDTHAAAAFDALDGMARLYGGAHAPAAGDRKLQERLDALQRDPQRNAANVLLAALVPGLAAALPQLAAWPGIEILFPAEGHPLPWLAASTRSAADLGLAADCVCVVRATAAAHAEALKRVRRRSAALVDVESDAGAGHQAHATALGIVVAGAVSAADAAGADLVDGAEPVGLRAAPQLASNQIVQLSRASMAARAQELAGRLAVADARIVALVPPVRLAALRRLQVESWAFVDGQDSLVPLFAELLGIEALVSLDGAGA